MRVDQDATRDLILDIYDTALDPSLWPSILDKIGDYVGARGAFIFELENNGPQRQLKAALHSAAYDPSLVKNYLREFNSQELADQDIFEYHSKKTDGIDLLTENILTDNEQDLLERPNVKFMLKYGIRHRAAALLNKDQTAYDRFALQFSEKHGPMNGEDRAKMAIILPHIAKALSVSRPSIQLSRQFKGVVSSLNKLKIGVCVLDRRGVIVHKNQEFERQMHDYNVFVEKTGGVLEVSNNHQQSALSNLMEDVFHHGHYGARPRKEAVITNTEQDDFALCIELCPLSSSDELNEQLDGHVIYSIDTSLSFNINTDLVAKTYALTPAEQSTLSHLAEGSTNNQISERRNKSTETINSQVKSILAKTQSANRAQLIRLATNMSFNFLATNSE